MLGIAQHGGHERGVALVPIIECTATQEMRLECVPLHAGVLREHAEGGRPWANGRMQTDRGSNDPLMGLACRAERRV